MANLNFSSLLGSQHISIQTLTQYIDGQIDRYANNLYANASHITIGNSSLATLITSENISTKSLTVGNNISNVSINSTSFMLDSYGSTNTYIDAYQAQFSGVVKATRGISISGSLTDSNNNPGNAGDVLLAGGPGLYWSAAANNATNLNGIAGDQYAFANTFLSYQTLSGLASNVITITANNTLYVGNVLANDVVSSSQLVANLVNYQTNEGLSDNVATLTANNTSYVGEVDAINIVSNAQLQANLINYQPLVEMPAAVALLTANNANNLGDLPAENYATKYTNNIITGTYTFNSIVYSNSVLIANNFYVSTATEVNSISITGPVIANASQGSNGLVLTSNGTGTYWSDVTNYSGGIFDGGNPFSSYIEQPRLDAGGVY